ncbi:hypothetical protein [Streptomyces atratus]|uniref:hypothetical protein n=1 Tax=Streptomyces atratus TaxID=1893 RepID=UPI002257BCA0|nr:hypothetical protein [Streptomyces atratus]MCX5343922.1 hypothetical protein [Streptomyces atratus]
MSDVYAVDLALDLRASAPSAVLADLRWHLGIKDAADDPADDMTGEIGDMFPLLAARGPAARIGGVLVGELARTADGWSLTARQEVHAESLPELDSLVVRLARNSGTEGVIGQIRFYEEDVPDLLVSRAGELVKRLSPT